MDHLADAPAPAFSTAALRAPALPESFCHRYADVNGIRMHYVDEGEGPLVILLHGFPYLWYMWRHQIPALAAAGYRVVAPDLRGFGRTDCPQGVDAYNIFQAVGDVVGLLAALGERSAVLVGHDLGAWIAHAAAQLRPDLFPRLALLCTPAPPRGPCMPSIGWQELARKGVMTHHHYFQEPGKGERELERDVRHTLRAIHYSVSGSATEQTPWNPLIPVGETLVSTLVDPEVLPDWLPESVLDYYAAEYGRTGFSGALNYYRCRDRNWELTPFLAGAILTQPCIFVGGQADPLLPQFRVLYDALERHLPGLAFKVLLNGAGHGAPEEVPHLVNGYLLAFLQSTT